MIVIVDTEYTTWPGALEGGWSEPGQHREIVQIAAVAISPINFVIVSQFDAVVRPMINPIVSPFFTELTGIAQQTIEKYGRPFPKVLDWFSSFVTETDIVCMNMDEAVFEENCLLNRIEFPFRDRFHRLRPLLDQHGIDPKMASGDLHRLTEYPIEGGHTHNALHDVMSMARWLCYNGGTATLDQMPKGRPDRDHRR